MSDLFTSAARRILEDQCTLMHVRAIEAGNSANTLWQHIEEAGFADTLVTESHGGAELSLRDVYPMMALCGEYLLPIPLAETMLARALLCKANLEWPTGSICFGEGLSISNGLVVCPRAYSATAADWVLASMDRKLYLLPVPGAATESLGVSLDRHLQWSGQRLQSLDISFDVDVRVMQACAAAAQLAGAMQHVFGMTLAYANERQQFGRAIGKFQAIQHQLAVMAEQVSAATMAAQIGCGSAGPLPKRLNVAIAKARTSEAALEVAASSHSIHGAIGFTSEFDLQLFTRRLHSLRQTAGSESYWHDVAGESLCNAKLGVLDFARELTSF
jgi:acyl-CoA dehydrogenase